MSLKLGTRGSRLALAQCNMVLKELESQGVGAEKITVSTSGDQETNIYIHEVSGTGVFEREIDALLLQGKIDAGVHSMKDIPSDLPGDIEIVAVLEKKWPRDVLLTDDGESLSQLAEGATVGTSSVRRRAQLLWHRSDLNVKNLRGNLDTRLEKLDYGSYDTIVVAEAGLKRLGKDDHEYFRLPTLPAANQGVIAVTAISGTEVANKLGKISHDRTFRETSLERTIIEKVGGGCDVPLGVLVEIENNKANIMTRIFKEDGADKLELSATVTVRDSTREAEDIGEELSRWREKYI